VRGRRALSLGDPQSDDVGRAIVTAYPEFTLINCYFPNRGRDHSRVPCKLPICAETVDRWLIPAFLKLRHAILRAVCDTAVQYLSFARLAI
jgi:hypothetical protein